MRICLAPRAYTHIHIYTHTFALSLACSCTDVHTTAICYTVMCVENILSEQKVQQSFMSISEKVFVWSSDLDQMLDGDEGIQLL